MTTQNVDKIYDGNGNQFNIQIDIDRVNNLQTTLNGKAASSHNHDASNITSGTFPTARIADDAITAAKVKDNETLPCNISGTAVKANTIDLGGNSRWIWASSSYSGSGGGQSAIIGTLSITANGSGNWNNIHENLCWCSRHSGSGILSIYVCMPGESAPTGGDPTVLIRNSGAENQNSFSQPVQCRLKRTQVSSGTCRYEFTFYVSMNDYNFCGIYGRLNSPRDRAIQFTTDTNIVNNSDITDDAYGPWLCESVLNVANRDSSGNWIESTYLKLSGGNMTGNIGYTSGGATSSMIKFRGGSYGHGISIGGGGCTIVGSGESSDAIIPQISVDDESLHLGGDDDVVMYANLQNGWSNRKTFCAGKDGNFYIPGAYYSNTSGGTLMYWKGNQNITAVPTESNQEWSIDLRPGSYTGTYWHVWTDKDSKGSLLKVETDNGHVSAPYGFYGSLTGNASTATKATQDESGNNIKASYASSLATSGNNILLKNKNGSTLSTITAPYATSAGSASSVAWSGITSKPTHYTSVSNNITNSASSFQDITTGKFNNYDSTLCVDDNSPNSSVKIQLTANNMETSCGHQMVWPNGGTLRLYNSSSSTNLWLKLNSSTPIKIEPTAFTDIGMIAGQDCYVARFGTTIVVNSNAARASQDANGNNIHTYYGHTIGITNTKTLQLKNSSGTVINAIDLPYVPVVFDQLGSAEAVLYCL